MTSTPRIGTELFFSYSHRDRELRDELDRHLSQLKRNGIISVWHDRQIGAGTEWAGEIDAHLERAGVILLLVSADFLGSDYCYDIEVRRAMDRHAAGTARVIPVILRSVDWAGAPFSNLQAVPTGAIPVTSWPNRDEAFTDVARAIRGAVAELASEPKAFGGSTHDATTHYRSVQRRLIDDKSRVFVGRDDVFRRFDRFIAINVRGYFIVEGPPGYGKSALAAKLTRDRQIVHHFIGSTGGRCDVRLILGSMIEQLGDVGSATTTGIRTLPELRQQFEDVLHRKTAEHGRVIVVVDALNELPFDTEDGFSFLPIDGLPHGAYVFLTTQPDERVDRWKEQLSGVSYETMTLGPLADDEVTQLIRHLRPSLEDRVVTTIVDAARGAPLYVQAAVDSLERDLNVDFTELPESIEGYFRSATRAIADNDLLRDVLGLLAVCRKGLSLHELSEITGIPQRRIHSDAIQRVKPFLTQAGLHYELYHQRFHQFVAEELLFGDELRAYHRKVANWLELPASEPLNYRWTSLAYHLFHAHERARLLAGINGPFLRGKLERLGYGVLEDIELLARSLFETGDAAVVERCVSLVEGLRSVAGDMLLDDLADSVRPNRGPTNRQSGVAVPSVTSIPGFDIYAAMIPRRHITADFVEVAQTREGLVAAIGDAPSNGLKSAFVARFLATAFTQRVQASNSLRVGRLMSDLNRLLFAHDYFERVSMQCIEIASKEGIISIANAGHPYPVLYRTRRGLCDILRVQGPLLHDATSHTQERAEYEERHAEIQPGDVLIMVTDGLTEGGRLDGAAYQYRFAAIVEQSPRFDAKSICEAILEDWRRHPRDTSAIDDVAVLVICVTASGRTMMRNTSASGKHED